MAREAPTIWLTPDEDAQLRKLAHAPSTPQALAFRARLILCCDSRSAVPRNDHVAEQLGCSADTVSKWRGRFFRERLDGLFDRPRPGRPRAFSPGGPTQGPVPGHH
jgi:putative transposase